MVLAVIADDVVFTKLPLVPLIEGDSMDILNCAEVPLILLFTIVFDFPKEIRLLLFTPRHLKVAER